jgi:Zn-dependent protease
MDIAITTITLVALPLLFAITVHEVMHGYVALKLGDATAYRAGRLSLNPLAHVDPVGTVILPISLMVVQALSGASPVLFGWAKPVPVDFSALNNPKRDMFWVALAGPASNVVMAIFWGYLARYAPGWGLGVISEFLGQSAAIGVVLNVSFAAINLLPILPLDGGRVLVSLLPMPAAVTYSRLEPYGFFILMGLVFLVPGLLWTLLTPIWFVLGAIVDFFVI